MKKNNSTVTIGIPAYNEEANIRELLIRLLSQKQNNFTLKKIIVASDGSGDKTVKYVRSIKDSRIMLLNRKSRIGAKETQNEILKFVKSDILVMLDADVIPISKNFVSQIVRPLLEDSKVGLVGADTVSVKPRSFLEKVIADSHELKKDFYKSFNKGDNLYLCHGRARAFSQKLYSIIQWPNECPEDAYSYLYNRTKGFKFKFAPKAKVLFRSPSSFADHEKQSSRFLTGKGRLKKFFPKDLVEQEFHIPTLLKFKSIVKFLIKKPVTTLMYLFIYFYVYTLSPKIYIDGIGWDVAHSSKKIIYEKS